MTDLRAAAQQALEVLIKASSYYDTYAEIAALKAALAEPVEPVAWQWLDTGTFRKKLPKTAERCAWNPLYATPPQRKPLTDEEILRRVHTDVGWVNSGDIDNSDWISFARAIERAHGIGEKDE
jgi:hypothetical protein